ncbi:hypothetical protein ACFYT3_08980 [Nocardia amikacinitolerans]|uniref:Uncharacterized protein n=1 Tax=Nocardia amikacinitolerans TaxID=756689 RepID=A0A285LBN9_9NOCA|nr:hypothetical protein [Nocardia amikacinitolerans]SNY81437.1 hypothetical protein SAMN04244553_3031 [Nocardia amikacinitolerans]
MKLRSLLHRRQPDQVPLLPSLEPDDGPAAPGSISRRAAKALAQEERLERLLTPSELEMVLQHRV